MTAPNQILIRLDRERRGFSFGGSLIEQLPLITREHSADGSQHTVIFSALTDDNADAAIAGEIQHFAKMNAEFEWKVYAHDSPSDLSERLARHGFEIGPHEALLVLDLGRAFEWITQASEANVIRVDTLEQVDIYRKVAEEVFEKNYAFTANELSGAIRAGSTHHRGYIAFDGERPVSIGRLYSHRDSWFGGLYGGGTLKEYRGKGFYRAVVAARARDAIAAGSKYLIVDALPTSCPILLRLGFEKISQTWPAVWTRKLRACDDQSNSP